jgi:hypothetical protein
MLCAVCQVQATAAIVPSRTTLRSPRTGKTVHLTTIRLCTPCRAELVEGRIKLGWSWLAEGWGVLGTESPAGDRYLEHTQ